MKLNVKVPDDLKSFIDYRVATGSFSDAGDFLAHLLYNFKAQTESRLSDDQQLKLEDLRKEVNIGMEQAKRSDFAEFTAEQIISGWSDRSVVLS